MSLVEKLAAVRGTGVRIIARVPPDHCDEEIFAFEAEARQLGYVVIDAQRNVSEEERRRCWHRHVVLITRGLATPVSVRWVRELAHASPRAHAVLAVAAQPDRVHEATLTLGVEDQAELRYPDLTEARRGSGRAPRQNDLETRARRLWQRGRAASARRWTVAAVEHARRSSDEPGAALAFTQLLAYSNARADDAVMPLVARGRRLLMHMDQLAARSHVVAALAGLWITIGEFEAAISALAAVDVECELSGIKVPPWIRVRQCEIACWQGCWDRAETWARDAGHLEWRALVAFARRDWAAVETLTTAGSRSVADDDACQVVEGPSRWDDVLTLERLRMAAADDEATDWIQKAGSHPRGRVEHLLWQWSTGAAETGRSAALEAEIRRLGAEGIRRWGLRRQDMHMWAGVSSLLAQVHEAEDAAMAMRRGCRWAREYTGVDAVGIVSADGAMIASDPDSGRRLDGIPAEAAALRYGGVRIGDVVLHGAARDQPEARVVARALATACAPALRARLDELQLSRAGEALAGELLGVSPAMRALRDAVARAAASAFPVLIEGESGTGKELVARALHRLSPRRDRRWAAVNCAALTDELLEAELFGHVRGAFTGAVGARVGLVEDAHEGTLFLDEVAELSPRAQAKLLRVLQEGEIRRVGENVSRRVDVRLVTATNRSLAEVARQGAYREDLIFRLAVIRLRVPPLRDRIEDVPLLAQAFWRTMAARASTRAMLGPDAIATLCRATWPGNVRELQNVIAALAVGAPSSGRISARQVEAVLADRSQPDSSPAVSLAHARMQCDRRVVAASLARHANQRAAAARELGVSRQGLAKLIARLNLDPA